METDQLIEKIINNPLQFTDADFEELMEDRHALDFGALRQLITRIFDINEATLRQQSDATTGAMGYLNRKSTARRQKKYYKRIHDGFRHPERKNNKVIVAEGDSWFQFPLFIDDIIDWLSHEPHYAVYSIAYGGDWFTNILYEEKYVEELSIHLPDVFLISGGGNDFVGSNRLAIMVDCNGNSPQRPLRPVQEKLIAEEDEATQRQVRDGYRYITEAFYSFIIVIKAQYFKLFQNLHKAKKLSHMKIITQGYDYVLPTYERRSRRFLQSFLNRNIGSGRWLKQPLMLKGITDPETSANIMKALITEINVMFTELAEDPRFPRVYHIDCRGTAASSDDWFDELHLHSEGFKKIARTYKQCIDENLAQKRLRVVPAVYKLQTRVLVTDPATKPVSGPQE